jgi:nitroreductase
MDKPAPADHPIHDLIRRRWSPRAFAPRPVEPDKLLRLLEAARWAPSSYNEQPWAYLVASSAGPAAFAKMLDCLVEGNRAWAKAAPVLMVSVAHRTLTRNGNPNPHAWHDVGLASAMLTLQATADGLAVHQMAGILPDRVRETYGVPADWDPVAGLAVGYPGDPDSLPDPLRQRELAPRTRKPLAEFIFADAWGHPAAVLPGAKGTAPTGG